MKARWQARNIQCIFHCSLTIFSCIQVIYPCILVGYPYTLVIYYTTFTRIAKEFHSLWYVTDFFSWNIPTLKKGLFRQTGWAFQTKSQTFPKTVGLFWQMPKQTFPTKVRLFWCTFRILSTQRLNIFSRYDQSNCGAWSICIWITAVVKNVQTIHTYIHTYSL
jgi:hypothetical protein